MVWEVTIVAMTILKLGRHQKERNKESRDKPTISVDKFPVGVTEFTPVKNPGSITEVRHRQTNRPSST
jgi:hypothetical protein